MKLADLEWIAALAYPLAILISLVFGPKTPAPSSRAPASISELKEQVLTNARLLFATSTKAKKGYIDTERFIIAIVADGSEGGTPKRRTGLGTAKKAVAKPASKAVILDLHHDEDSSTGKVVLEGPTRQTYGGALEALLLEIAVTLAKKVSTAAVAEAEVQDHDDGEEDSRKRK